MRLRSRARVTGGLNRPGWLAHALAALDMDFAGGRYFGKQLGDLTVTRASAGYAQDQAGSWQNFAANTPRRTDRGLLVEMARTNVLRNNSMQGASAAVLPTFWAGNLNAASGMVSSSFSAPVTDSGIDCINVSLQTANHSATVSVLSFDGQATGNGLVPVTPGSVWTGSVFLKLLSGSLTTGLVGFDLAVREYNSAGTYLAQTLSSIQGAGAAMSRQTMTVTTRADCAYITLALRINYAAGGSSAFSLRVGWPQLEAGGYATSPIRTTGAAQTRAADLISLPVSGVPNAFSVICSAAHAPALGQALLCNLQTSGSPHVMFGSSGSPNLGCMEIGDGQGWSVNRSAALLTPGQRFKSAFAYTTNSSRLSVNGGAVTSNIPSSVVVPSLIYLGSASWGALQWGGYIERLTLVPAFLTNAELQAVTT